MGAALFRLVNGLFALMFLLSVLVQYNDPDPLRWMALYGAAFGLCIAYERGRLRREVARVVAAIALLWAAWIYAHLRLEVPLGDALEEWDMHSGGSEEARETGGLLLVVFWALVLGFFRKERSKRGSE